MNSLPQVEWRARGEARMVGQVSPSSCKRHQERKTDAGRGGSDGSYHARLKSLGHVERIGRLVSECLNGLTSQEETQGVLTA